MAYKVLRGAHLTSELLNEYEKKGYSLVDVEEHMGMYDIILSDDSGGGGGGSIAGADKIDTSLKVVDKTLGVNIDNSGNVYLEITKKGLSATHYWKLYEPGQSDTTKNK